MQLKISTSIRKSVITVELETVNFCSTEHSMLDQFGEPVFDFERMYEGEYAVSIHKKIRSNFKIKVKFDGTKDIEKASKAANTFIEEIQDAVPQLMEDFVDKAQDIDIESGVKVIDIDLHDDCHRTPVLPRYPHIY